MSESGSAILLLRSCRIDIFCCSPTSSTSGGGRLSQGGKEKFVTRLAFRLARGERRNEEAMTSLKAYRVEFVGPLTEYLGTEMEKGNIKTLPSAPDKSKIKFINHAKKKPLIQTAALHSPTLSGGQILKIRWYIKLLKNLRLLTF